jgi:transcriptional regulator with XRE-family HTH domain
MTSGPNANLCGMKRGPYRVHRARVVLGEHGYTMSALAERSGMSPSGLSRQLAGECRLSEQVRRALVEMIGDDGAAAVVDAIPQKRTAEQAAA